MYVNEVEKNPLYTFLDDKVHYLYKITEPINYMAYSETKMIETLE